MLGGDQKSLILLRVRTQKIQLNNGDTAFLQLQREGHTIFYALEAWVDGTPIWLQARMPDTFFYQNEHVLLSVIKSLEIPGSIENRIYDIEQNHPEPVITALLPGTTIHNWRTYSNYSYGYSILYPADWPISADYDAHDGRVLYIGNPDFDVRITGMFDQYEPSWDSHIKGAKEQIITLDNGESAHLFITKRYGQIVYHVVWVRPRILCWFTAEMSETLYAQQQDTIEAMARSLSSEPSWIDRR